MTTPAEPVRLNKRMAELGICSRREADAWIAQGWVKVNGQVAEMGQQVTPSDRIEVDKQAQNQQATEEKLAASFHETPPRVSALPAKG